MFDIILDENQLEDACEHMADYLEAYWKSTHPASCNPPNPLLPKVSTAALPSSPAPVSSMQVQALTRLRAIVGGLLRSPDKEEDRESREGRETSSSLAVSSLYCHRVSAMAH